MINNKIDLLIVLPLTREFTLLSRTNGFVFRWLDYSETQWELKISNPTLYNFIEKHVMDVSIYQREPFKLGSATHQWLWYYGEYIPSKVKETSIENERAFHNRLTMKFRPEHFGKGLMESYIKEQLKKRKSEYLLIGDLSLFVGSWNCAGTSPNQSINSWLRGGDDTTDTCYDIIFICLQEICELNAMNMLGNESREESWHNFIKNSIAAVFPTQTYQVVIFYIDFKSISCRYIYNYID